MCHLNVFISRIQKILDFLLWLNKNKRLMTLSLVVLNWNEQCEYKLMIYFIIRKGLCLICLIICHSTDALGWQGEISELRRKRNWKGLDQGN